MGPDQAILFDIPGRRYYMFDLVMHAQDIFWLTALLFLAAVLLFFVTTLFGRVFCGYFCFQTIWTDAFRWIEKFVQGDRVARLRLDKQAWNVEKIRKVGLTHALWLLLAMWTGLSFALYWGDAFETDCQVLYRRRSGGDVWHGHYPDDDHLLDGGLGERICVPAHVPLFTFPECDV